MQRRALPTVIGTVISYKVSSLCVDITATGGEKQCVALQYGRRPVSTLTYQQIFNVKRFQRAIRWLTAVQPTACQQFATVVSSDVVTVQSHSCVTCLARGPTAGVTIQLTLSHCVMTARPSREPQPGILNFEINVNTLLKRVSDQTAGHFIFGQQSWYSAATVLTELRQWAV
jgi:hypothetical protein